MVSHPSNTSTFDQSPPPLSNSTSSLRKLEVIVVFTELQATLAAMHRATRLLSGLNGHISLVDIQIVPRQLPLEQPPVSTDFTKRRLLAIANASVMDTTAYVYLCRSRFEALEWLLKPGTLIVMGSRKRWWPTWDKKLTRELSRAGYHVVLHECQ